MSKKLTKDDYTTLLIFIFQKSQYNPEKVIAIFNYVSLQLAQQGYHQAYVDKLTYDLKLFDIAENIEMNTKFTDIDRALTRLFTHFEIIEIRSIIFSILGHGGYFN